jgi:NAD(P)-dependent dehydrogenase (short-subunit alcohol dehydrogenase family)
MRPRDQPIPDRLSGYTAVVTGGGGTVGTSTAVRFAREGADVVVTQRSRQSARRVVDNAADLIFNWAESTSRETFDEVLATNLTGPFQLAREAYEHMREDGYGRVINVGAIQSRSPLPGAAAYASSKAEIDGLTRSPASEWSGTENADITVNTAMVGPVYQGGNRAEHPDLPLEEANNQVPAEVDDRAATLVGRRGRAEDVAALLAFLASPESSFITAAVIPCDGGRLVSRQGKVVDREDHIRSDCDR